jgi:hypothetical protein
VASTTFRPEYWRPFTATVFAEVSDPSPSTYVSDQALQALVEPADHAVFVLVHAGDVDALKRRLDAELRPLPRRVSYLGGMEQRFGRNATAMQAGTAEFVAFDQGD